MTTQIGIFAILAGLFLGIFNGISQIMGVQNFWTDLTLSKLCGTEKTESVITLFDSVFIQDSLDSLFYNVPVFGLLIFIGIVSLVISFFTKAK